jgi:hypothetical protein
LFGLLFERQDGLTPRPAFQTAADED